MLKWVEDSGPFPKKMDKFWLQ